MQHKAGYLADMPMKPYVFEYVITPPNSQTPFRVRFNTVTKLLTVGSMTETAKEPELDELCNDLTGRYPSIDDALEALAPYGLASKFEPLAPQPFLPAVVSFVKLMVFGPK